MSMSLICADSYLDLQDEQKTEEEEKVTPEICSRREEEEARNTNRKMEKENKKWPLNKAQI